MPLRIGSLQEAMPLKAMPLRIEGQGCSRNRLNNASKKHPLEGLKGKGAQGILNRCLYLQKEHRFSAFCFGPSARFLEKLSLISLLKSDLKIQVFPLLTLSNIELTFFKKKKKRFRERKRSP